MMNNASILVVRIAINHNTFMTVHTVMVTYLSTTIGIGRQT